MIAVAVLSVQQGLSGTGLSPSIIIYSGDKLDFMSRVCNLCIGFEVKLILREQVSPVVKSPCYDLRNITLNKYLQVPCGGAYPAIFLSGPLYYCVSFWMSPCLIEGACTSQ